MVALECEDDGSQIYGILASTDRGVVTDDTWWCSSVLQAGWADIGFSIVGSPWTPATEFGVHGQPPWGKLPGIADEAMWIWTDTYYSKVYCRKMLGRPTCTILSLSSKVLVFIQYNNCMCMWQTQAVLNHEQGTVQLFGPVQNLSR